MSSLQYNGIEINEKLSTDLQNNTTGLSLFLNQSYVNLNFATVTNVSKFDKPNESKGQNKGNRGANSTNNGQNKEPPPRKKPRRWTQRIGIGLFLSVLAMAVAALVEAKRKSVAAEAGAHSPLPITFLWIAFQYLFLGSADLFTLAGLLEFFFTEAPTSMRSLATSLSWASLAVGYYMSTVIVSVVNDVTGGSKREPWLSGDDINSYRLGSFYWLMCVLSVVAVVVRWRWRFGIGKSHEGREKIRT